MKLTLFTARCTGNKANCVYPDRRKITSIEDMSAATKFDHVCAAYRNNYRSRDNFISSDTIVMDCDNDHSENPAEWITPKELDDMMPDTSFVWVPSRHNMLQKEQFSPRPRGHVYFPIQEMTDEAQYARLKTAIQAAFPFFDENALDSARFIFGADTGDIRWHEGWMTIDEDIVPDTDDAPDFDAPTISDGIIHQGSRNKTLSLFAGKVLKRFGDTERAHDLFIEQSRKCDPPLPDEELSTIWSSARRFLHEKVQTADGYVDPETYNADFPQGSLKPDDYSDIGQAKVLQREYGGELIYTSATDYLRYDGTVWCEDKQMAVGATIELLDMQLADAEEMVERTREALISTGLEKEAVMSGGKALEKKINGDDQMKAFLAYMSALSYHAFVMKRRDLKYITSAMGVAKALLNHDINELDTNPNLLNTPTGTCDLEKGLKGMREHSADDMITKITECAPGDDGAAIWCDALNTFFCGNQALIDYVQRVVGMAAVGKVYQEHLIIAYGVGANGKSTFWNTIARVLGSYAGKISPEVLTVANKRNAKPEMAELKGKRLIIASEMEEGMRLNTAMVKQLCSTDAIQAEKKYEKPFHFIPTHTLVLYTNHLPRVGANDDGIWRRLVVIPFEAKITGKSDIKNYADYLFEKAGSAIMSWIIEGARIAIELEFKWALPDIVQKAVDEYRQQNDWFAQFVDDCCEVSDGYMEKSGAFYDEYRSYCTRCGEYTRNSADFYAAVEKAGYQRKRTSSGRVIVGVRLKSEFLE